MIVDAQIKVQLTSSVVLNSPQSCKNFKTLSRLYGKSKNGHETELQFCYQPQAHSKTGLIENI